MNINRHNYETFFLLYIDHELSVAEKKGVDEFVKANPDLEEELVMLQQSKLPAESIAFGDKGSLFKVGTGDVDFQEKLLLHLDNELLPPEIVELEEQIQSNTDVEKEWSLLQQTKLLVDGEIVFEDKQSLYRKERGRLVAFPWRRVLAAAVFIGFGAWGGLLYFNNTTKSGEVEDVAIAKNTPTATYIDNTKAASIPIAIEPAAINRKEIATNQEVSKKTAPGKTIQSPQKVEVQIAANRTIQISGVIEKNNNIPKSYLDKINSIGSNKIITAYVTPEKQINTIVNPGSNDIGEKTAGQDAVSNVYASTASFTDNSEESDNHVFFMDEEKLKKTKIGGMFRKVKRVIERNTNIKTGGNNIKVANLEFAIQ